VDVIGDFADADVAVAIAIGFMTIGRIAGKGLHAGGLDLVGDEKTSTLTMPQ
jgi:hypothetical protein